MADLKKAWWLEHSGELEEWDWYSFCKVWEIAIWIELKCEHRSELKRTWWIEHSDESIRWNWDLFCKVWEVALDSMSKDKSVHNKPCWDDYFFGIMHAVSARATCDRGRSGCVIAKDNHLLVTGYVGALPGAPECDEVGHLLEKVIHADGTISEHCHRTIHCEQNAIYQAARTGVVLEGSTLYCTMTPCRVCAMAIIRVGIVKVMCEKKYHQGKISEDMFRQNGVEVVFKNDEIVKY